MFGRFFVIEKIFFDGIVNIKEIWWFISDMSFFIVIYYCRVKVVVRINFEIIIFLFSFGILILFCKFVFLGCYMFVVIGLFYKVDFDRIVVKKIVLSGYFFKINKWLVVLCYMFFNRG